MEQVKVAAYCRVSTDKEDQLNSLEYQTYFFQEQVKKSNTYKMYKVYADKGITATSWKRREQFKNMLFDAGLDIDVFKNELRLSLSSREPLFKRILVKDVSRFTRNINAMEIISKLKQKGVYVDFVTANLSTETLENDVMLGILMLLAEQESKDRSVKVQFGQRRGAERGVIQTGDVFYGYRYIKETNSLEIVPEEADVVRVMYQLYNEGKGFRNIIKELNRRGIKTRRGKSFVQQSVKRILTNPAYKGWLVRNKIEGPHVFSGRNTGRLKPENEWIIHKGRIPAIVSEEAFDSVQRLRESKINYQLSIGIKKPMSEFAGIIVCSKCGSSFVRNKETSTQRIFFNCSTKKKSGVSQCASPNVFESEIEEAISKATGRDFQDWFDSHKQTIVALLREVVEKPLLTKFDAEREREVQERQQELLNQRTKKQRLADLYLDGTFDIEYLKETSAEIDEQIGKLESEIEDLSKSNEEISEELREVNSIIQQVQMAKFNVEGHEEVGQLIKNIVVFDSGKRIGKRKVPQLTINFKFSEVVKKQISVLYSPRYAEFSNMLDRFTASDQYTS